MTTPGIPVYNVLVATIMPWPFPVAPYTRYRMGADSYGYVCPIAPVLYSFAGYRLLLPTGIVFCSRLEEEGEAKLVSSSAPGWLAWLPIRVSRLGPRLKGA
ncbi:hypothetical protein B0H16DRAFT_1715701 [Mycena metata]|uniref:Uncharacterized protein n=1 Tax=Mycena metata TaxID=1033252 RepID=A0AAD7JTR7_9AGAR|nr:hypothetical protein B0H16DRAFT_1715701 [Mycena metata]